MTFPRAVARPAAALLPVAIAALFHAVPAAARFPYRDPLPWGALADSLHSPRLDIDATRCDDGRTGWTARRFAALGLLPRRGGALFFVRVPVWALDTANLPVARRWPAFVVPEGEAWPHESRSSGAGNPELGWIGQVELPLLGRSHFGVAASLPFGKDALYPFGSTSMALRLQLQRPIRLGPGLQVAAIGGNVISLDSALDRLDAAAYPGGQSAAVDFSWRGRRGRALAVGAAGEWGGGGRVIVAGLAWTTPSGGASRVTLGLRGALGRPEDRPFATLVSVIFAVGGATPAPADVAK